MTARTVARVIVEVLASAGATRVYGVAGDSLNGITDAIYDRRDIRWIPMRHEEAGAFAAMPTRISPESSRSAREAAVPATCI
jgi:pyruvate dehydrogenase (quinone)